MKNTLFYKNFITENMADEETPKRVYVKAEKKKMKIFISSALQDLLRKMMKTADFQAKTIANFILNIDQNDEMSDISYIDIDKTKDDGITFMPAQRAWAKMDWTDQREADIQPTDNSPLWTAAGRQPLGIGRFVNKISDEKFSDMALDQFIKTYKAEVAATQIYDRFKLVKGEDIRFWYAETNYYRDPAGGNGAGLLTSCMRYDGSTSGKNTQAYLDIYCKNPEKCSLLILTNKDNKLMGRAVVWNDMRKPRISEDKGYTFMDRIYCNKISDVELFKKYATEQGWVYKYNQSADDASYVEKGNRVQGKSIAIGLNKGEYKQYPYMDTLKYYNPTTGRLGSDPGYAVEGTKRFKLDSTGGGASVI